MKKSIILLAVFFGSMATVCAQDTITMKSGDEVKAKVQEVGLTDVKYKKYDNLEGPVYTLLKTEIFMIKYENGEKDVFKDQEAADDTSVKNKPQEGLAPTKNQNVALGLLTGKKPKKSLEIVNTKFENAYGEKLSAQEVRSVLADMPDALELYESGRRMHTIGSVFLWVGVAGVSIGGAMMDFDNISKLEKGTSISSVGLGCIAAAVILGLNGNAKWKSAYNTYQSGKNKATSSLDFGLTRSGGIGFVLTF